QAGPTGHKAVRTGKITVDSRPWSEVRTSAGKLLGITPLALTLPVGDHALKLVNPEQKLTRAITVTVAEEKPAIVRVDLRQQPR
ncbi:MAG TPA: PEGA domain-containing protein, partial [Myxococcota bacterium]